MKPHSRGLTSSSFNNNQINGNAKYKFSKNSWRELKYFQIFNLHQDQKFQRLMTLLYRFYVNYVDSHNNEVVVDSNDLVDEIQDGTNIGDQSDLHLDETQLNDRINSFIDSKYDLRIFANSLVSYEEVKEAYINLESNEKRKYYWLNGCPSGYHQTNSTSILPPPPSPTSSSVPITLSSLLQQDQSANGSNGTIPSKTPSNATVGTGSSVQSPLSLYTLLNGTNNSSKSVLLPYLNSTGKSPQQCTQPTVDQVIKNQNHQKTLQLLLNWKCDSNVQEYSLMMESPKSHQPSVIYRGHNNFYTTPPLEVGTYHFKVRATNRFGVGDYSDELKYIIKESIFDSNSNNGFKSSNHHNNNQQQQQQQQQQQINSESNNSDIITNHNNRKLTSNNSNNKQNNNNREIMDECLVVLNQIDSLSNKSQMSQSQCEETMGQLLILQSKCTKLTSEATSSTEGTELLQRLTDTMDLCKQLLQSYKQIREWKILTKNLISEFIHNSSSNDNEQLERINNLLNSFSKDLPDQIKLTIFQIIIQFTKKKLTESPTIKSRTAILLTIISKKIDFFGEASCLEMENLSKQLLESKKKKKPISNINAQTTNNNTKKPKQSPRTTSNTITTTLPSPKLSINTTPQLTVQQLQQQKQAQQQQQLQQQQPQPLLQPSSSLKSNEQVISNTTIANSNANINNMIVPVNNNNNNFIKSESIPIKQSIKCSNDEIINDINNCIVPSSPIGSPSPSIANHLIVSPPKSQHLNNNSNNNMNFYSTPPGLFQYQGYLTPVLSNLSNHNINSNNQIPNPSPQQQQKQQQLYNNFTDSNQSLFYNSPFKSNSIVEDITFERLLNNNYNYNIHDDYFQQRLNTITTTTTTTTTTTSSSSTIGKQTSQAPIPDNNTSHSFSFYHIVPN
ncbi:hypothetical protein DLAC_06900 [Tieghemostelium lacteum]|uniref:Fibronectin type-III domain-containing protein n=1 Tax=Tieghemostelium lacteum TaxID=361077 RepID=A0A151ZDU6_TIELA|nr:hypothetical protein DLAC_06900 [Tieghemostelium lacteum]|eukprot:KYQ92064.1 hypothetical protein DLAC_06900 [Tieghemostelium lacteum]